MHANARTGITIRPMSWQREARRAANRPAATRTRGAGSPTRFASASVANVLLVVDMRARA
jgi:hypothetical protein